MYVGQHAGKDVYRSRTVRGSKREAELRKFLDEVERQVGHDDHHVTVEQLFNRWWPRHKHDLAGATVTTHEGDFRRHILPQLGEHRVVDVRGRHLDAWMAEMCGLRWSDVDLDAGAIRVVRSITKVAGGHQVKSTKTGAVSGEAISASTVERLRSWRCKVDANPALVGGELSLDANATYTPRP